MESTAQSASLSGRTFIMSGGSRGIGLAIARAAAAQGANVVLLAKTGTDHPTLPGTVHTAAAQIIECGGRALPVVGDVRDEAAVRAAVDSAVAEFGGIDAVVNNAGAIDLSGSTVLTTRRFDLMQGVNTRGCWLLTTACLPHLSRSPNPHVLSLSPPLNLSPHWLGRHPGYTVSKYAMTLLTLGWAAEFVARGIAFNCLWPETLIATAAVRNVIGGADHARDPAIMADAAMIILKLPAASTTGNCYLDAEVLHAAGTTDLRRYGGGAEPPLDLFVDSRVPKGRR